MASHVAWSRKQAWFFLSTGLMAIGIAFALDNLVDPRVVLPVHSPLWEVAFRVSKYGDWPPVFLVGLGVVAILLASRRFAEGRLLALILVVGLLTGLASTLIRSTVGRTRPTAEAPQGFYGPRYHGKWIIGKYQFASFPSGHTAVWAGLAGAAWSRRRPLAAGFLVVAVIVAWSRMALNCHHLSDVTASMIWGLSVGPWLSNRWEKSVWRA